jgi:cell division protein ZapA
MSQRSQPLTLRILDKEYVVACPESERLELLASVDYLNQKMREVRNSGKILGTERIAVIAALTIVHDLLQNKPQNAMLDAQISQKLQDLHKKVEIALAKTS